MNPLRSKYLFIGFWLCVAAAAGFALKPTDRIADHAPKVDLTSMIPAQFADWQIDGQTVPLQVDAHKLELMNQIYSQILARTYVNPKGERIMLSIAYGGDQSESMKVHKPETCYPANGFRVMNLSAGTLDTGFGNIPVKRLLATRGTRVEPIIYWITVGDTVAVNGVEWKLAQLKYGLTGKVPDGLIFRVSSLGDEASAYPVQEDFIRVLLKSLPPEDRKRLIGGVTN